MICGCREEYLKRLFCVFFLSSALLHYEQIWCTYSMTATLMKLQGLQSSEVYFDPCPASKIELFAKINNGF